MAKASDYDRDNYGRDDFGQEHLAVAHYSEGEQNGGHVEVAKGDKKGKKNKENNEKKKKIYSKIHTLTCVQITAIYVLLSLLAIPLANLTSSETSLLYALTAAYLTILLASIKLTSPPLYPQQVWFSLLLAIGGAIGLRLICGTARSGLLFILRALQYFILDRYGFFFLFLYNLWDVLVFRTAAPTALAYVIAKNSAPKNSAEKNSPEKMSKNFAPVSNLVSIATISGASFAFSDSVMEVWSSFRYLAWAGLSRGESLGAAAFRGIFILFYFIPLFTLIYNYLALAILQAKKDRLPLTFPHIALKPMVILSGPSLISRVLNIVVRGRLLSVLQGPDGMRNAELKKLFVLQFSIKSVLAIVMLFSLLYLLHQCRAIYKKVEHLKDHPLPMAPTMSSLFANFSPYCTPTIGDFEDLEE